MLVKNKCPTKGLSELPYLRDMGTTGQLSLNPRHHYYGQVQGQMMVSTIYKSCFFIYCGVDDFHLEILMYDEKFCQDI